MSIALHPRAGRNKWFDFLIIGGLSLFVYLIVVLGQFSNDRFDFILLMSGLAFIVNWPHFAVSYQMLYGAHRHKIFASPRFFFAAVIVPVLLTVVMVAGAWLQSKTTYVALLLSMFFLVGWHYVKQSYGCFVVYGASQGFRLSASEQRVVKFCLYSLWMASFVKLFLSDGTRDWWGLTYSVIQFPKAFIYAIYGVAVAGGVLLAGLFFRRFRRGDKLPDIVTITPLVAAYLWLFPPLKNGVYFYMIPFFHSLQYLLFSGTFTRNYIVAKEKSMMSGMLKWWGGAFILGVLGFSLIPETLDSLKLHDGAIAPLLFFVAFNLFINIHHYFIDNVMWRSDNPEVRRFVTFPKRSQPEAPSSKLTVGGAVAG